MFLSSAAGLKLFTLLSTLMSFLTLSPEEQLGLHLAVKSVLCCCLHYYSLLHTFQDQAEYLSPLTVTSGLHQTVVCACINTDYQAKQSSSRCYTQPDCTLHLSLGHWRAAFCNIMWIYSLSPTNIIILQIIELK